MVTEKKNPFGPYRTAAYIGLGTLAIIIVMIFAVGRPLLNAMNRTRLEVQAKNQELDNLEQRLKILKELEAKKAELEEKNKKVLAALPEDTDVSRLFVQLENIANQNGLSIQAVSSSNQSATTGAPATQPAGTVTPVTYTVAGTVKGYDSLKKTLAGIESALRVVSVDSVKVSGEKNNLSATFTVTTYVRGTGK